MAGVILGTMSFGDTVTEDTARGILDSALSAGITEIDTAVTYAGGESERMLGRLLRDLPVDAVRVSSKVGMQQPRNGGPLSAAEIVRCARESVDRLGRPLDTLYMHQPDRSTTLEETVDGLSTVLDEGLAERIVTSNHASWQVAELTAACRCAGIPAPVRAQQLYNPVARELEVEFLGYAAEREVELVVYNPLAGGLLTDRYADGRPPESGRFADSALAEMYRARYWRDDILAVARALAGIAADAGMPLVELCLRWLVCRPEVDSILLGASRAGHVAANVAAVAAGPLPESLRVAVDAATAPAREHAPAYAR